MAFRKTIRSNCRFSTSYFGFSETKPTLVFSSRSSKFQRLDHPSLSSLSKETLPLIDLKTLLDSNKVINGNVSFAPSDLNDIEYSVYNALSRSVSSSQSVQSSDASSSASDTNS